MQRICPKCTHINEDARGDAMEACPKCGVIYSKAVSARPIPSRIIPAEPILASAQGLASNSKLPPWIREYALPIWLPSLCLLCALAAVNNGSRDVAASALPIAWLSGIWLVIYGFIQYAAAQTRATIAARLKLAAIFAADGCALEDATFGIANSKAIIVDAGANRVLLYEFGNHGVRRRRAVPFSDLLAVELYEDGQSIAVTSGGSSIGRAIVGRALFGVAGEVIGGTTAKRTTVSHNQIGAIELRISIKDVRDPIWDMGFLSGVVARESQGYRTISEQARRCAGALRAAIAIGQSWSDGMGDTTLLSLSETKR